MSANIIQYMQKPTPTRARGRIFTGAPQPRLAEQGLGRVTIVDNSKLLPGAYLYNSSLLKFDDALWLFYRRQQLDGYSDICVAKLDPETLQPIPEFNQLLGIPSVDREHFAEDPRTFWHDGKAFISYYIWGGPIGYIPIMCLTQIVFESGKWRPLNEDRITYRQNGLGASEKNWSFFSCGKNLKFIYKSDPHLIAQYDKPSFDLSFTKAEIDWKHGEIRGGTPPLLVDGQYWTFFHSSEGASYPRRRYHMGAYSFKQEFPHEQLSYTPEPLLSASEHEPFMSWAPVTVFPCGSVYDNDEWIVSMGVNDCHIGIAKFSHAELKDRVVPITKHLREAVRLRSTLEGVPGGWNYRKEGVDIEAHSWSTLLARALNKGLTEEQLHEYFCNLCPEELIERRWV